jgi:multidrug resistance efflux pump
MTNANDIRHPLSEPLPAGRSGANGDASLSDRVRSLRLAGRAAAGRSKSTLIPWGLSVILLLTALGLGYRTYRTAPPGGEDPGRGVNAGLNGSASSPSGTASGGAVAASGSVALQAKGYIIPAHQIQVSPKISGMIVWLDPRFEEGQHFKEGDVLARLEDVDYRTDRDHAAAYLKNAQERLRELKNGFRPQEKEQARADLMEQEANLKQLKLDLDRSERLAPSSALAQRDFELAKYSHDAMVGRVTRMRATYSLILEGTREEQIQQAEANVKQAEADLAKAQWRLDQCAVTAPVTGTILTKKAEKGNIVNPVAFNISASLCDMADLSDLEVDLKVQERDIAKVEVGQRCTVMPEAYQNFERFRQVHPDGYEGRVSRMMPTADRNQGAIPVRIKLKVPRAEEGVYLRPDMGVIVNFLKPEESN